MSEYKKLSNQPLKFVLAEFRYSPVLQIANYIPQLQETFRKKYPVFDKRTEQSLHVHPGGLQVTAVDSFLFISSNRKHAIEINQDRLVFFTSDYPRYDEFESLCREALQALVEVVAPALVTRIGLRYGDLILVEGSEAMADLVDTHLTLPSVLADSGNMLQQRNESLIKTSVGGMTVRSLYGTHGLSCFPDIQGLPVDIDTNEGVSERMVLDFDHFWEAEGKSVEFDINMMLSKLKQMHDISRAAFWKITTDYARNVKWDSQ